MNKKKIYLILIFILSSFLLIGCNKTKKTKEVITVNEVYVDASEASTFSVSKVFSDSMVLQRNERIRIFGFAPETENGKKVTADFMMMHSEAIIENGEWEIVFPHGVKESLDNNELTIKASDTVITFKDILVGDCFMVVGQSNVAYSMANYFQSSNKENIKIDDNAPIRINYNSLSQDPGLYVRGSSECLKEPNSIDYLGWEKATFENIQKFSAYGYLFAYHFINLTDSKVPVGLIEIDGNGQPLGSFLPNEVAEKTNSDTLDDWGEYYIPDGLNARYARYLYNEFMYPFERYPISGLIWYQGESDLPYDSMIEYEKRFTQLITYMRSTHHLYKKDFNVYMTEFPTIFDKPIGYSGVDQWQYLDTGNIRGVVSSIPYRLINNSYLVVSSDLWSDNTYWNNLHPNCKYDQALRLAKIVSSVNENKYTLDEVLPPMVKTIKYNKDSTKVTITFDFVGEGLKLSDNGKIVKGFLGLSREFNPDIEVEAKIVNKNTIEIVSTTPLSGIAYNTISTNQFNKDINVCDSYNNPLGAFLINK